MRMAEESVPCSASLTRSRASLRASAVSSARITASVGPRRASMRAPEACASSWVAATYGFPGPAIAAIRGIVSVPTASAATPATPLQRKICRTPSRSQATRSAGSTLPSCRGGTTTAIDPTPATTAGVRMVTAVDGNVPLPDGKAANAAVELGDEIVDPSRTIPRSFAVSIPVVTVHCARRRSRDRSTRATPPPLGEARLRAPARSPPARPPAAYARGGRGRTPRCTPARRCLRVLVPRAGPAPPRPARPGRTRALRPGPGCPAGAGGKARTAPGRP